MCWQFSNWYTNAPDGGKDVPFSPFRQLRMDSNLGTFMKRWHLIFLMAFLAFMAPRLEAQTATLTDNFERTDLGSDWAADASYRIVSGTLDNTDVDPAWKYYGIFLPLTNPTEISYKYATTGNIEGANSGGVIMHYDQALQTGYFILRRYGDLTLHPIIGGIIKRDEILIASVPPTQPSPKPGDVIKVVATKDGSGHHFNLYINNVLDGRLTDTAKLYGNGTTLYGGLALYGQRNNNIDDFTVKGTLPPTPVESVTVTSPNGGETWYVNSSHAVTWSNFNFSGNVKIELSTNNGASYSILSGSVANTGSYTWSVPNSPAATCRIRISDAADASPSDISNSNFTIAPEPLEMRVTSPNGGELLYSGLTHAITWTTTLVGGNVKIDLSQDGGSSYTQITGSTANTGSYTWTVPAVASARCRVRIADAADGDPVDISNSDFEIAPAPPNLAVTRPNGGDNWLIGSQQEIRWTGPGPTAMPQVRIRYSINAGSSWSDVVVSTDNDGSYIWTVPHQVTTQALIQIEDAATGVPSDRSDNLLSFSALVLLRVNNSSGQPGSTNNRVSVSMDNLTNVRGLSFRVNDAGNLLTAMNVIPVGRATGFSVTKVDNGTHVTIYLVHMSGGLITIGSGPVAQISYDVSGAAVVGGDAELTLSDVTVADANSLPVVPELMSGHFYFVMKGDVSGDGVITTLDIDRAVEIILKKGLPMTPSELLSGDMDSDGDLDLFDLMNIWELYY